MVQRYEQTRKLQWYKRGAAYFIFVFCTLMVNYLSKFSEF